MRPKMRSGHLLRGRDRMVWNTYVSCTDSRIERKTRDMKEAIARQHESAGNGNLEQHSEHGSRAAV